MKTNFSLLFYLKKQKNYVSGNVPIYMRITVEGNRAIKVLNTHLVLLPMPSNQVI